MSFSRPVLQIFTQLRQASAQALQQGLSCFSHSVAHNSHALAQSAITSFAKLEPRAQRRKHNVAMSAQVMQRLMQSLRLF